MRDDIHKSAPVARRWQQFLKRCVREADQRDRIVEAAAKATAGDCRQEISGELLAAVLERCSGGQTDFFARKLDSLKCSDGVLGQTFLNQVRVAELAGPLTRAQVAAALAAAIDLRLDDRRRAMVGHLLKEGGPGAAECVAAIRAGIASVSSSAYADEIIVAGELKAARNLVPSIPPPSLDERLN